jgi:hypothetical protein
MIQISVCYITNILLGENSMSPSYLYLGIYSPSLIKDYS